jgi:hypothetical protein
MTEPESKNTQDTPSLSGKKLVCEHEPTILSSETTASGLVIHRIAAKDQPSLIIMRAPKPKPESNG